MRSKFWLLMSKFWLLMSKFWLLRGKFCLLKGKFWLLVDKFWQLRGKFWPLRDNFWPLKVSFVLRCKVCLLTVMIWLLRVKFWLLRDILRPLRQQALFGVACSYATFLFRDRKFCQQPSSSSELRLLYPDSQESCNFLWISKGDLLSLLHALIWRDLLLSGQDLCLLLS